MLFEAIKLALQAIRRNALRSFLTVLGIVIGVGAVIAMVTIGNGTTAKVTADLAKLGSNLLFVSPGQFGPGRASSDAKPFNARDVEAMKSQLTGVKAVAPVAQKSVDRRLRHREPHHGRHRHRQRLLHHAGLGAAGRPAVPRRRAPRRPRRLHHRRRRCATSCSAAPIRSGAASASARSPAR